MSEISEESKDILISKIHHLEFIDIRHKLKGFYCCKCKNVALKHRIANCDDVFCEVCYRQCYKKLCPFCQTIITESKQDEKFEKSVFKLKVSCEYKKNGCQEIVRLEDFLSHVKDCKWSTQRLLPRVYKADPTTEALEQHHHIIQDMKNMIENIGTEIGRLKDAMTASTKKHEEEIVEIKKSMKTKNELHEEEIVEIKKVIDGQLLDNPLLRQEIENQLVNCLKTTEFKEVLSSSIKGLMKVTDDVMDRNISFMETVPRNDATETLSVDQDNDERDWQETTFNWTITGVKKKLENCKKDCDVFDESKEYTINAHGLKFKAMLRSYFSKVSWLYVTLHFNTESLNETSPFLHSRKYFLVDQSNDEMKRDVVFIDQPRFGQNSDEEIASSWFWDQLFFPISLLRDSDRYVKYDKILIRIILEPIALLFKHVASMDGILLMRIDNYSKKKQDAIDGIRRILISESFYTSAKGHRMDVEVYLNGILGNLGKRISILPVFRIGEWDDLHPGPIHYKCQRVLVDQSDEEKKKHIVHETGVCQHDINNIPTEFVDFITHEEAEQPPYLMDDTLLIKVLIMEYKMARKQENVDVFEDALYDLDCED